MDSTVTSLWTSMSQSTPVAYVQQGLVNIHDFTGLPWWASVILSTVLMRSLVTLPLAIYQNKIVARLEKISLEMPEIVKGLKLETAYAIKKYNWTEQEARITYNRSLKKQWDKLVIRENCHPAKTMIVLWGQIPLWVMMSVSFRNMLINLAIIEIQNAARTRESSKLQRIFTNVFRGLSVLMVPVAATVPSCLSLYWVTSSAYGLCQNLMLMSPRVKRLVGVPQVPSELANPYQHVREKFAQRGSALLSKVGLSSK
ncbi:hypothetical protein pipiens_016364 [Culex pipiens pipiens]|uniref:Mitochondrial inner membrane protein COX18 n=1 Tax=Culex pipiens pipiens TaxID=38569 RepID=A0ABD1CMI5_CULPP